MIGMIFGYIVGSEHSRLEDVKRNLNTNNCGSIDDAIYSIAICKTLIETDIMDLVKLSEDIKINSLEYKELYPSTMHKSTDFPSTTKDSSSINNIGIRVSPVAWVATTIEEALLISDCVTQAMTSNPKAIINARAITFTIFLARHESNKNRIRQCIQQRFYPLISILKDEKDNIYQSSYNETITSAIIAFLESNSFEGAIWNAVHMEKDSLSLVAITGAIAEAYYGIPQELKKDILSVLDKDLAEVITRFEHKYQN